MRKRKRPAAQLCLILGFIVLSFPALSSNEQPGLLKRMAGSETISASSPTFLIEKRCTGCHSNNMFVQLRLGELGWDYVVLREKYFRGAEVSLSERRAISHYLAQTQPAGMGQTALEWGVLFSGIALILALGSWGVTHLLDTFGKGDNS